MTSIYDVLKASKGIHVDDTFAELWGRKLSNAYTVETYIGTLPATLRTVKGYLESYKIYGNTVQDGTPTPENPIMPIGCGERTENFWNFQPSTEQSGVTLTWNGAKIVFSGICTTSSNLTKTITLSAGTYTIKANANRIPVENDNSCVDVYKASPYMMAKITNRDAINGIANFTLGEETTVFLRIRVQADVNYDGFTLEPMLNLGSTPLPYEPYGYKLPLTVNGAKYPIYLNEPLCGIDTYTDSLELSTGILTRKIKKLVLTGEQDYIIWKRSPTRNFSWYLYPGAIGTIPYTPFYCSHGGTVTDALNFTYGTVFCDNTLNFGIFDSSINSLIKVNNYFAQQYAAGTPVTIWYVLAEPEISTIPVPSGLTGTIEGYLIQDGTPTPETPIYPTANGVKQADGTYIIPYSVEYPIYLGEVETTRKIKKLELNGTERFLKNNDQSTNYLYYASRTAIFPESINKTPVLCNELPVTGSSPQSNIGINTRNDYLVVYFNFGSTIMNAQPSGNTIAGLKEYLAAQYANGTPVTVWYVLAKPETGIVNEPLMKIGDYTDTVSMEQAGVSISTFAGTTVIDYNGTPKPDKVELTYRKPKGQ